MRTNIHNIGMALKKKPDATPTLITEPTRLAKFICFVLLGLLNFILKKRCTISRGAEPHVRKANDEKTMMIGPC